MNINNENSSLDIYYPDSTYNTYNIKDFNDNCDGLCTYDNVGLYRPSYTRIPNTNNDNIFNKYIWIENNNNALLYLTINGAKINGYLRFNENTVYPLEGNIITENKKASFIMRYPQIGIMDQGTMKLKKKSNDKYNLELIFSKYSKLKFHNGDLKKKNYDIDASEHSIQSVPSDHSSSTCTIKDHNFVKEALYISTMVDDYSMFIGFDSSFVKNTEVFLSYNPPKYADKSDMKLKRCKKLKEGKYNVKRNIPNRWMIEEYNQSCQFLIYSYSINDNTGYKPSYYLGCNQNGGVNVSTVPGSENQVWEFIYEGDKMYIKSVYYGWYLGYSSDSTILDNTLIVRMTNRPIDWKLYLSNERPTSSLFKPVSKLNGYYTYIHSFSDKSSIDRLIEININKKGGLVSIPLNLSRRKNFVPVVFDVEFEKNNKLVGSNKETGYKLTVDVKKIEGERVVLNVYLNDPKTGNIINLSGNPNNIINNYSLKIPELIPKIQEGFDNQNSTSTTDTLPQCPPQYPYAYGTENPGVGPYCCIGNPGTGPDGIFDCAEYGCYGKGCGPLYQACDSKNNNQDCQDNSNTKQKVYCPESHKFPYNGSAELNNHKWGGPGFFCSKEKVDRNSVNAYPENDWITCPNPPCEPYPENKIDQNKLSLDRIVQQIVHVENVEGIWKLITKENPITGINIKKEDVANFIDTTYYVQKAKSVGISFNQGLSQSSSAQQVTSITQSDDGIYIDTNINPAGIKIDKKYESFFKNENFQDAFPTIYLTPLGNDEGTCISQDDKISIVEDKNCYVADKDKIEIPTIINGQKLQQIPSNESKIKTACSQAGGCFNSDSKGAPWCYRPGPNCNIDSDCDDGYQCSIDPICSLWNSARWFKNDDKDVCKGNGGDNIFLKNCNGLFTCDPLSKLESIYDRPAVGSQPNWKNSKGQPTANLNMGLLQDKIGTTDKDFYSAIESDYSGKYDNTIIKKCYHYGLDYKNVKTPYSCWSSTNSGNFKVLDNTDGNRGMCIKNDYLYYTNPSGLLWRIPTVMNLKYISGEEVKLNQPTNASIINNYNNVITAAGKVLDNKKLNIYLTQVSNKNLIKYNIKSKSANVINSYPSNYRILLSLVMSLSNSTIFSIGTSDGFKSDIIGYNIISGKFNSLLNTNIQFTTYNIILNYDGTKLISLGFYNKVIALYYIPINGDSTNITPQKIGNSDMASFPNGFNILSLSNDGTNVYAAIGGGIGTKNTQIKSYNLKTPGSWNKIFDTKDSNYSEILTDDSYITSIANGYDNNTLFISITNKNYKHSIYKYGINNKILTLLYNWNDTSGDQGYLLTNIPIQTPFYVDQSTSKYYLRQINNSDSKSGNNNTYTWYLVPSKIPNTNIVLNDPNNLFYAKPLTAMEVNNMNSTNMKPFTADIQKSLISF